MCNKVLTEQARVRLDDRLRCDGAVGLIHICVDLLVLVVAFSVAV